MSFYENVGPCQVKFVPNFSIAIQPLALASGSRTLREESDFQRGNKPQPPFPLGLGRPRGLPMCFMASQAGNRHPDRERWPWRSCAVSGSCWSLLRIGLYLPGAVACLSPRFYPHSAGPAGPLLDGVPRFGGRCYLRGDLDGPGHETQSPLIDGYALRQCQSVPSFSVSRWLPTNRLFPLSGGNDFSARRQRKLPINYRLLWFSLPPETPRIFDPPPLPRVRRCAGHSALRSPRLCRFSPTAARWSAPGSTPSRSPAGRT